METSNSSLSTEHQNLSKVVSPRISTSLLHFDSQEVGSDNEGIIKRIMFLNQFLIRKKIVPIFLAKIKHETLYKALKSVIERFYFHKVLIKALNTKRL